MLMSGSARRLCRNRSRKWLLKRIPSTAISGWGFVFERATFLAQLPKMIIFHTLDPVRQHNKAAIDIVQLSPVKRVPQLLVTLPERMTPGMFAQYQSGIGHSH